MRYLLELHDAKRMKKQRIIEHFGKFKGDTGSTEVMLALLTSKIENKNIGSKKDHDGNRRILQLKQHRMRMFKYLKKSDPLRYFEFMKRLENWQRSGE